MNKRTVPPVVLQAEEEVNENPDKIYMNSNVYLFVKVINGVVHVVRVYDAGSNQRALGDSLEVRTAFRPEDGMNYVQRFIAQKGMWRIQP